MEKKIAHFMDKNKIDYVYANRLPQTVNECHCAKVGIISAEC